VATWRNKSTLHSERIPQPHISRGSIPAKPDVNPANDVGPDDRAQTEAGVEFKRRGARGWCRSAQVVRVVPNALMAFLGARQAPTRMERLVDKTLHRNCIVPTQSFDAGAAPAGASMEARYRVISAVEAA
jgi:hypothetical protein